DDCVGLKHEGEVLGSRVYYRADANVILREKGRQRDGVLEFGEVAQLDNVVGRAAGPFAGVRRLVVRFAGIRAGDGPAAKYRVDAVEYDVADLGLAHGFVRAGTCAVDGRRPDCVTEPPRPGLALVARLGDFDPDVARRTVRQLGANWWSVFANNLE